METSHKSTKLLQPNDHLIQSVLNVCHGQRSFQMHYPNIVRRLGAVPGLVRLLSLALEVISIVLLTLRHRSGEAYVTDYLIVSLGLFQLPSSLQTHVVQTD